MTPINSLYSYTPRDGYGEQTTADVLGQMNALYSGPGGMLRSMRNAIPESHNALSIMNMARSGLGTAANWMQGRPEIGPDTLAPLGIAAVGTGAMNALARPGRDWRMAESLQPRREMFQDPVLPPGWERFARDRAGRAQVENPAVIPRPDADVYGQAANMNTRGPIYALADNANASTPGLTANSTKPSADSALTDILRRYGLME